MIMTNHICWQPQAVHQVIRIDAEAVGDNVFRAVHTPLPIRMSTTVKENLRTATDEEFLRAFTNPDIPEIFSLVLGDSGAGKTHFIHWLRLNVPLDTNTRLINIPKVGTSLRSIVELIIRLLPDNLQGRYLDRLTKMGTETQTREELQEELLDSLAQVVSAEMRRGGERDDVQEGILQGLGPLFRDPHVRRHWFLANDRNTIIKELTDHVFEPNEEYRRLEKDRHFTASDFHIRGLSLTNVSKEARDMLDLLKLDPNYKNVAAELANRCLDAAIGKALRFSGDDLNLLIGEVRKHLHEQRLSLILFIEDLSRMQGVDKALLDALTTPSDQGGQKLCTIRWVAAMTTGYFNRLEATIGTRINLMGEVVANPKIWGTAEAQDCLAMFMGRYLNAVRLGLDKLNSCDHTLALPNACEGCIYKEQCHEVFGTGGEFGMYPFTPEALWNMSERSARDGADWFNPRRLLRAIITPMLAFYGPDILEGRFPRPTMIEEMGGERLSAPEKVEVLAIAGIDAERHLTLQELWQPLNKIVPFHDDLLTAFNLRPLNGRKFDGIVSTPSPRLTPQQPKVLEPDNASDPIIDRLRDWGNKQPLDDKTASEVRGLVFDAVVNWVDWDREGIVQTPYIGKGRPFTATSIVFRGQLTGAKTRLQLNIPLQEEPHSYTYAAMALQGLYLFNKNGHWDFEGGHRYFVAVQNSVEKWAQAAVDLVRGFVPNDESWNALDAATELLAVGGALSGNIVQASVAEDIWSNVWGDAPEHAHLRLLSPEMQRIAKSICSKWDDLRKHVNAHSFGIKGGSVNDYLNPAERKVAVARLIKNKWNLLMKPDPEGDMHADFKIIARLYVAVAQGLGPAMEAEAGEYKKWLEEMDDYFGSSLTKSEILNTFNEVQMALNDGAILSVERDQFQNSLEEFRTANYQDSRQRAGTVGKSDGRLGPHFFAKNGVVDAMQKGRSLALTAKYYLDNIEAYCEDRCKNLDDTGGASLDACWNEIEDTLDELDDVLGRLANLNEIGS